MKSKKTEDIYAYTKHHDVFLPKKPTWRRIRNLVSLSMGKQKFQNTDILFFLGTKNHFSSAHETLESLRKTKTKFGILCHDDTLVKKEELICDIASYNLLSKKLFQTSMILKKELKMNNLELITLLNVIGSLYILEKTKAKILVLYNDHSAIFQHWMIAAKFLEIPIVYIQHASVSKNFPTPLFDYGLLDGNHASQTYKHLSLSSSEKPKKIYLVGQQKKIQRSSGSKVGVAINSLDDVQEIFEMSSKIKRKDLVMRWHPAMDETAISSIIEFCHNNGYQYSDSNQESQNEFLSQLSHLIAGDTSLILEAALAHVIPVYWTTSTGLDDYYEFVKNGIAIDGRNRETDMLTQHSLDVTKLQDYSTTARTSLEGKEGQLSAHVLRALLKGENPEGFIETTKCENDNWHVQKPQCEILDTLV